MGGRGLGRRGLIGRDPIRRMYPRESLIARKIAISAREVTRILGAPRYAHLRAEIDAASCRVGFKRLEAASTSAESHPWPPSSDVDFLLSQPSGVLGGLLDGARRVCPASTQAVTRRGAPVPAACRRVAE